MRLLIARGYHSGDSFYGVNNNTKEVENMVSFDSQDEILATFITMVDQILACYTSDEAGECEREKYLDMSDLQKLRLLAFTMWHTSSWEDFESELIVNFDFGRY